MACLDTTSFLFCILNTTASLSIQQELTALLVDSRKLVDPFEHIITSLGVRISSPPFLANRNPETDIPDRYDTSHFVYYEEKEKRKRIL